MENDYQEVAEKAKTYPEYQALMNISKSIRVNTLANYFNYDDIETIQTFLLKKAEQEIELGCPVDVLFKALKNNIYYVKDKKILKAKVMNIMSLNNGNILIKYDYGDVVFAKDYKKTWWLKEDKSE